MTATDKTDPLALLTPCSFIDSFSYSPWPARLVGASHWMKSERSFPQVLAEYEEKIYGPLREQWSRLHPEGTPCSIGDVVRFFNEGERTLNRLVESQSSIYGTTIARHLVSSGGNLLLADLNFAMGVTPWLLRDALIEAQQSFGINQLVELGCGDGKHLFRSWADLHLNEIRGGEICPSAVELGNIIARSAGVNAKFSRFDFHASADYETLTGGLGDYALYTHHALEQIPEIGSTLFDSIWKLKRRPKVIIFLEPLVFAEDQSPFSFLSQKYALTNKYNTDLWKVIKAEESRGRLVIHSMKKWAWGVSAFNPTSIVVCSLV